MNGLVLIDKPKGLTSHDVVKRWRKIAFSSRAGHLGTLDPMATGLLILVSGNTTRLAQFFEKNEKTYEAEIRLGYVSNTYDAEGEVQATGVSLPTEARVKEGLSGFRGPILQTPPPVSAKKINGVRAYKLAGRNEAVELSPVPVEIKSLEVLAMVEDTIRLRVTCSAGTYIRGIAHDLGRKLGCGGILSALRRTASGGFRIEEARTLEELQNLATQGRLGDALIPPAGILPEFPAAYVDEGAEAQIRLGREFRTSPFVIRPGAPFVKALSFSGELIAIGRLKFPNVYHPMMVL
jgi:tRNA pseudouridine55 synthase